MPELSIGPSTKAEDVFAKEALVYYEKGMAFFHNQLVKLNVNIYLLEEILSFPLRMFLGSDKTIFFSHFIENTLHMNIILINRLIDDNDEYTINKFQNKLLNLVKAEYKKSFQELLKKNRFSDPQLRDIRARLSVVRDKYIAHLTEALFQEHSGETSRETSLYFSEIKFLRDKLNNCFDNLSFNRRYLMLPLPYLDKSTDDKTDIEEILDNIARNSFILNLPEQLGWQFARRELPESKINQINYYRKKLGMPEV